MSAPLATLMLADLGARVIKVEPPRGDPLRRINRTPSGVSPLFVRTNHDKRSVKLDLKTSEGLDGLARLTSTADVFVTIVRESALTRLGIDDAF